MIHNKLTTTEKEAIKEFHKNGQDPIPHMPCHYNFWSPAITQIATEGGDEKTLTSRQSYLGDDEAYISTELSWNGCILHKVTILVFDRWGDWTVFTQR